MAEIIPGRQAVAKELRSKHGDKVLGNVTVEQVFGSSSPLLLPFRRLLTPPPHSGGMRGVKAMLWEPSVLDSEEGIRFWGKTIPECQAVLPTAEDGTEMLPEAMFWYLLTSKVPTAEETKMFQNELASRAELPAYLEKIIDALREFDSLLGPERGR